MEPTMHGQLATAITTAVFHRPSAIDGDDGDNEPMWSLELASQWARLNDACYSHALVESEPLITTALTMLPPKPPTVAREGCVVETRSNKNTLLGPLIACPRSYPFPRLPRICFQSYKPTYVTASTCVTSLTSLPRFLTTHGVLAFLASARRHRAP
jgi:hypothetical protein